MKRIVLITFITIVIATITGCNNTNETVIFDNATQIELSDEEIKADGEVIGTNTDAAVYIANDIVYYESGYDFTYGEGSETDAHTKEEAMAHTVVHISQPGTYCLSGELSKGQIAVDLGEDAEGDPEAVVTLILNNVDITCDVAPAIIFYNVYECGDTDTENASKDIDTTTAGANIVIADGTTNTVNGSYVARIYKPDSVVLSEDGTEVEDAKKLHKYDGALYSKMSMNIEGGTDNSGILNINAENEGLDSELHLTINGGNINIVSGNDGINTNEDGVSVTTINNGVLNILVNGNTGEGDGIDSNGWLVINGGTVITSACADSADAGIDSDMGIHINGGTVMSSGHMLDRIEDGGQNYAVFHFAQMQDGKESIILKDEADNVIIEHSPQNSFSVLIFSSPELKAGIYTLWSNDTQLAGINGGFMMGGPGDGGMMPGGGQRPEGEMPEFPENIEFPEEMNPENMEPPEIPEGMEMPEWGEKPMEMESMEGFEMPEGVEPPADIHQTPMGFPNQMNSDEFSKEFVISKGENIFGNVSIAK